MVARYVVEVPRVFLSPDARRWLTRVHRWEILVVLGVGLLVTGNYLARLLGALILALGIGMLAFALLPIFSRRGRLR
jgi:hypothetical protein